MDRRSRLYLSLGSALIGYFCIFFPLVFIIKSIGKEKAHLVTSLLVVILAVALWVLSNNTSQKYLSRLLRTTLIIGAIGFLLGFVGPLLITPEANLGPLLGIFVTGPLSLVIGLLFGALYWKSKS
jgi:4-amino-4-deoxy-L-arabinose transferase-like glycosyltransferase